MEHPVIGRSMSARHLTSEVLPVCKADAALRDQLFALMERSYDCITRARFEADLEGKDYLIILRDTSGAPRGFSTQMIFHREWEGRPIQVLFSGDTVIEPEFWGSPELVKGWCKVAAKAMCLDPARPLFWFLISKGYRTYLYLPLFFREFLPRQKMTTAGDKHRLLEALAQEKFGAAYNAQSGVVRFAESQGQLAPALAEVPDARRADPHVQFFLARNRGYAQGDELACLAEVSIENTHGLGRRWLERALDADCADD